METLVIILAAIVAAEGAVIMTLLAYRILKPGSWEDTEPEEDNPEARKQKDFESNIQQGLDAIQRYDIKTAMEVIRNNGADRDD